MKNYIDEKGNYINNENLSLKQIYDRGIQQGISEGIRMCHQPMIVKVKSMTADQKKQFLSEWRKYSQTGLVFTDSDFEVIPVNGFTRKELEGWIYEIAGNNLDNEFGTYCEELINRLDGFERYVRDKRTEAYHEDLSDNSIQE